MVWAVDQIVGNGYTLKRQLGEGGFGVTWLALKPNKQTVVIKTLNNKVQQRSDFKKLQQDFLNEALRLAKCTHPHIAKIFQMFQEGDLWCMEMEYIDGGNLKDRVANGALSEKEALLYIEQIGNALALVHGQDLLHRDIKPENIMLRSGRREAVLIDFGIAREFESDQTQTHTEYLTHGYAPIEQYYKRHKRGAYTDVYALAATLYSLLTGKVPVSSLDRQDGVPLPSPKSLNRSISDRTNQAILKGMAIKSKDRPQSMEAWLKMLEHKDQTDQDNRTVKASKPFTVRRRWFIYAGFASVGLGGAWWIDQLLKSGQAVARLNSPIANPRVVEGLATESYNVQTIVNLNRFGQGGQPLSHSITRWIEDLGNGVLLHLVRIPAGTFTMGSSVFDFSGYSDERPAHEVYVPECWMGQFEVTQAQYQQITNQNPVTNSDSNFVDPQKPIINVSWNDANAFCQALREKTGRNYRLPTEAEWEYACRACTTTPFHFGQAIRTDLVNYSAGNRGTTTPVGSFLPNSWGLYDMHGNVWEWCADQWYNSYRNKPDQLKQDGSIAWTQANTNVLPSDADYHLLRGGSWFYDARGARSADRTWGSRDVRNGVRGFRLVFSGRTP